MGVAVSLPPSVACSLRVAAIAAGCGVASAGMAAAQITAQWGVDVVRAGRYEWRGITRNTNSVWQADALAGIGARGGFLTVGAWVHNAVHADDAIRGRRIWLDEIDFWTELQVFLGQTDVSFGITRYQSVDSAVVLVAPTPVVRTQELYLRGRAPIAFGRGFGLTLASAAFWDIGAVRGWYVEPALAVQLPGLPPGSPVANVAIVPAVHVGARLGLQFGQDSVGRDDAEVAYYAGGDGSPTTHLDLTAGTSAHVGLLRFGLDLHVQFNIDEATRVVGPRRATRKRDWWMAFSASLISP